MSTRHLEDGIQYLKGIEHDRVFRNNYKLNTDRKFLIFHFDRTLTNVRQKMSVRDFYSTDIKNVATALLDLGKRMDKEIEGDMISSIIFPLEDMIQFNRDRESDKCRTLDRICFELAFVINLHSEKLKVFTQELFNILSLNASYSVSFSEYIRRDREIDIQVAVALDKLRVFREAFETARDKLANPVQ